MFYVLLCIVEKARFSLVTNLPTNPVSTLVHLIHWSVIKSKLTGNLMAENNTDSFAPRFGAKKSDADNL